MIRFVVKYVPVMIGMLLIVSGCTSSGSGVTASIKPTAQASAAPNGKPGGELTFAFAGPLQGDVLDPQMTSNNKNFRVLRAIFDSLVVELPDHTFKPWLATSWTIDSNQKSYIFKLRQDVKFHDGTPFNAEAVKFTFDRIKDPSTKAGLGEAASLVGPYTSSEVIDDYTIKLNFSKPYVPFLSNLAKVSLAIVSPTAVKTYGDKFAQNPVGTGPFKFSKLVPGADVYLDKYPDYNWAPPTAKHSGPALLDKLIIKSVPEEASRIAALQSKQAQVADGIPPQNVVSLGSDPNFTVLKTDLAGINYSLWFNTKKAPFDDVQVREAVKLGIDVDSIVKTLYLGTYTRAWGPLSPNLFGYDKSLENTWKPDVAKAGQILDERGWKKGADGIREKEGKRFTIEDVELIGNRDKHQDVVVMAQNQLKELGIELKINVLASGGYVETVQNGKYDLAGGSWAGTDPDVLRFKYSSENANPLYNTAQVSDPQLDQWMADGYAEADPKKREEIYKKIQQYTAAQVYSVPLHLLPYTLAIGKEVQDIRFDSSGLPVFYDAWFKK
ncbi:ABC transporter substrate-binding protein [Paenibacillus sp. SI8]|uniref:ABC transporter substrate-binding protein n=1 Tax=unclassified Paenibacillus TaxID=185978 RepID=UPI0034655773